MNAYENLYIHKTKRNNMNIQNSEVNNTLYKFSKNLKSNEIFKLKF